MDSVPSRRRARLVLLADTPPSVSSEPPAPSDATGDGGDEDPPGREDSHQHRERTPGGPPSTVLGLVSGETIPAAMHPVALADRFQSLPADPSEELGPGLGQGLGWLGGVSIALLTLLVPLTSVLLDRQDQTNPMLLPRLPDSGQRYGSHNPSGLSSAGVGESPGGDTGRKPQ